MASVIIIYITNLFTSYAYTTAITHTHACTDSCTTHIHLFVSCVGRSKVFTIIPMLLGFSEDPYNFNDPAKGNRVYFTGDYYENECEVLVYYSSTEQIVCITR